MNQLNKFELGLQLMASLRHYMKLVLTAIKKILVIVTNFQFQEDCYK